MGYCLLELCLQKILVSDDRTANKPFSRAHCYVHFFVKRQRNEPNESMFRCAKQQVFLARKASIAQSANEKRCAHGAAALMNPASSRATDDAPRRLTRTRTDACEAFAFAASKRTAKIEKLTHFEGKKSFSSAQPKRQTKNAARARIDNFDKPLPQGAQQHPLMKKNPNGTFRRGSFVLFCHLYKACGGNNNVGGRLIACIGRYLCDLVNNVHTADNVAKRAVVAVK